MIPKADIPYRRSPPSAQRRFLPLVIYLGYAVVVGAAVWLVDYVPAVQLREALKTLVPAVLAVNLLMVGVGLVLCAGDILAAVSSLKARGGFALVAVTFAAVLIAAYVAPRTHRIYYDEDIYANVGQTMAETGQAAYANYALFQSGMYTPIWTEYNKEPVGWPFILSLLFRLFGTDETLVFVANNLLFAGTVLLVFFITRQCAGGFFPALAAAVIYGLIPHNLTWANTGAVEPSAAFFAAAVALAALVYIHSGANRHLFLLAVLIPLASHMRPESPLIYFWAVIALLAGRPNTLARADAWGWALLTAALMVPLFCHLWVTGAESWGAEGAKFSLSYLRPNLSVNGPYFFNGVEFPAAFSVLALVGLLFGRGRLRLHGLLFLWFVLFWGIFLYFYAGSYNYGADERFALLSFAPLSVLAGLGAGRLRDLLAAKTPKTGASVLTVTVLVLFASPYFHQVRSIGEEAWSSRADHRYARQFAEQIPAQSVVLTHTPTMFLLWGRSAIQAYAGLFAEPTMKDLLRRFPGNVYFHYNHWCNAPTVRNERLCGEIMARYELELVHRATERDFVYTLYRINGFAAAAGP